jgi:hypothetical protein
MSAGFQYDEKANSDDLSDEEIEQALSTSSNEDIAKGLIDQKCLTCGKTLQVLRHEKRFRFPHFYWRSRMTCSDGHSEQRVFQVTWLMKPG